MDRALETFMRYEKWVLYLIIPVITFLLHIHIFDKELGGVHAWRQTVLINQSNPIEFQRPDFSDPYTVVNAQFTYNFKKLEIYTGCENIFNFRQIRPIISWQDPFSLYFDTSSVWGPTRGREIYLGARFRLVE